MKIGLLSDTHSFLDEKIFDYLKGCDEIWHAGDIGDVAISQKLQNFKPFRAVYGNIDGQEIRTRYPRDLRFEIQGLKIWMIHIGGYPGNYDRTIRQEIKDFPPDLFICGHSHILKVMRDPKLDLLHMNPGAAGKHGFHKIKTMLRFDIIQGKISNVEAIELGKRAAIQ